MGDLKIDDHFLFSNSPANDSAEVCPGPQPDPHAVALSDCALSRAFAKDALQNAPQWTFSGQPILEPMLLLHPESTIQKNSCETGIWL
jgi:hypothetical protein